MRPQCSEGQGVAASQTESMGEDWIRREVARSLTQKQQAWILMSYQKNKGRAQWVIDHTWISLLPVNSFWVMDKPGLWSGPAALYSMGKRVCVCVRGCFKGERSHVWCPYCSTMHRIGGMYTSVSKHVGVREHVCSCMKGKRCNMPEVILFSVFCSDL